ncbi:MAG: M48 family metalloprotease [Pyrinomonadaceae bacterium]|nr:M48 family metalloprotease [Pyrinomonadaceae bacterium]
MYFILGLSIVMAALLVLNSSASLVASLIWRTFERRVSRGSAARSAQTVLLLRTVPVALGIGGVLFLFGPAYLRHEPRVGHETVGLKLAVVAALSALGIVMALVRGFAAWRATSRLTADWLRTAEPIQFPRLGIPAYQVEHRFPLMAVVGALRPRLFIAKQIFRSLTAEELSAALEHEIGHIMAHDNLKRSVLRACRDMLLIIPCSRHLDEAWAEASEAAADEYAARRDQKVGLNLASALVKIARLIPAGARPTMTAGAFLVGEEGSLGFRARVRRLIQLGNDPNEHPPHTLLVSKLPTLIPIALTLMLLAITAYQPHVLSTVHTVIEHAVYILG